MKSFKIITGERGEGKTTYILSHFSNYKGYVTVHRNDEYLLKDLETKEETLLLSHNPFFSEAWKGWYINIDAFNKANEKLLSFSNTEVIVDEVGMLEVEERGFATFLKKAPFMDIDLVISVRREFIKDVRNKFFPSITPTIISVDRFL
ncbi:MAG: nucleoside-triphosphatase [Candidatus Ornithospirochaeta sp.]